MINNDFYVAKSYQGLPIEEGPYVKGTKGYCKVRLKSGNLKEVRTYNEHEYHKLYPEAKKKVVTGTQRKILGFGDEGYIVIFNGAGPHEEFFSKSNARYHRIWGWYIPSTETVPVLPAGVSAVVLPWENVGGEDGSLYPEDDVIMGVRKARQYA